MRILAVGAHYDDIELGCGGTLAKHAAAGDRVLAYVATTSEIADERGRLVRDRRRARAEGAKALRLLGARLVAGGFRTFQVEFTEALNRQLLRLVQDQQIDTVYTHWLGDVHHDHLALARATLHCCRHVPRVLAYRSNWYGGGVPFRGNFFVDISDFWAVKAAAIMAHRSERERTGDQWLPHFRAAAENDGRQVGVACAESFEVVRWLTP